MSNNIKIVIYIYIVASYLLSFKSYQGLKIQLSFQRDSTSSWFSHGFDHDQDQAAKSQMKDSICASVMPAPGVLQKAGWEF